MTKEIKLPTYEDGTPVCFGDFITDGATSSTSA